MWWVSQRWFGEDPESEAVPDDAISPLGPDGLSDEQRTVTKWRYDEARLAGMSLAEAKLYAKSDIPVSDLRRLVEAECPTDLIAGCLL